MRGGTDTAGTLPAECLDLLDLDGVFRNADVRQASLHDVPSINGEARRSFRARIEQLHGAWEGPPMRILPLIAPAGAGKTHLLSDFCRETTAAGGLFLPVGLTDLDLFWPQSCRASAQALLGDGRNGVPPFVRLAHALLTAAEFSSIPDDPELLASFLGRLDADGLRKLLRNVVLRLSRALPSRSPNQGDAVRCLFGLASSHASVIMPASDWIATGSADEKGAAALGLTARSPGPEAAFFAVNSLVASAGGFTVVTFDQLDRILSQSDGGRQAKADALVERLARVQALARRTLCVATSLGDVWDHVSQAVTRKRLGIFDVRTVLGPLTDPALMEQMIAARMRDAFDSTPGFVPPYPSFPFPRAFFETLKGKFPRDVIQAAGAYLARFPKNGTVAEWPPPGTPPPPSPPGSPVPVPGTPYREMTELFKSALAKFRGRFPLDGADAVLWQGPLEALAAFAAAESGSDLPAALRPVKAKRSSAKKLLSLTYTSIERGEDKIRRRRLMICLVPHSNAVAFQSRVKLAVIEAEATPRPVWSRRLVLLRATPPPTGQATARLCDYFVREGGVNAGFENDAGALMLALAEVQLRYPKSWREWAAAEKPVTNHGFLAADLGWLMRKREGGLTE
ncbi:MAG: hypothetical protein LBQ79_07810 [Deltaproteobacteria bacterium]|jgi:hypothetical protein|nr:hypothetical protein [Deltaproteobacteria bacterium]